MNEAQFSGVLGAALEQEKRRVERAQRWSVAVSAYGAHKKHWVNLFDWPHASWHALAQRAVDKARAHYVIVLCESMISVPELSLPDAEAVILYARHVRLGTRVLVAPFERCAGRIRFVHQGLEMTAAKVIAPFLEEVSLYEQSRPCADLCQA